MKYGQAGRADLVRALCCSEDLQRELAEQLGFELQELPVADFSPPQPAEEFFTPVGRLTELAPRLEHDQTEFQPRPVPFWRAESFANHYPEDFDAGEETEPDADSLDEADLAARRDVIEAAHIFEPLAPTLDVVTRLRRVTAMKRRSHEVDVERLVAELSRGRQLEVLPRRLKRSWGARLHVISDLSRRLIPYHVDQGVFCRRVQRLLKKSDATFALLRGNESVPRTYWPQEASGEWRMPAEGSTVLVLGDLGALDSSSAASRVRWRCFGEKLAEAGVRRVALIPCHPDEVPQELQQRWSLVPWERTRAAGLLLSTDQRQANVQRLMALLTIAVSLEPQLLRRIRRTFADWQYDPGVESRIWQHSALLSDNTRAAVFDPEQLAELVEARRRESDDLQQSVVNCVRAFRAGSYEGVWFAEILRLGLDARRLLSEDERKRARRWFQAIEEGRDPAGDRGAYYCMLQPHLCEEAERCEPVLKRLFVRFFADDRGAIPSDTLDPAWLQTGEEPIHEFELSLRGDLLEFRAAEAATETGSGSPIATIRSRAHRIRIDHLGEDSHDDGFEVDRDFWAERKPPAWTSRWGIDEFGPWAEFRVETPKTGDNSVSQRMRWIGPGTFLMGSPQDEPEREGNEGPQHQVTISRGFWMFETACTQALWEAVTGDNPSHFTGPGRPVEQVSWKDCQQFLTRLRELMPELEVTLPTEAQWEYACRAGTTTAFSFGENITPEQVNYDGNYPYAGAAKGLYRQETVDVGSLPANPWGLYEMHGNVWEWCADSRRQYATETVVDPVGPEEASADRVVRGGSWRNVARYVRAAYWGWIPPGVRRDGIGFRCRVQSCEPSRQAAEPRRRTERAVSSRSGKAEPRGDSSPASGVASEAGVRTSFAATPVPEKPAHDSDERLISEPLMGKEFLQALAEIPLAELPRPAWASDFGRDEFGLHAHLQVKSKSTTTVTQRLRLIPPGTFLMGSPDGEQGRYDDEGPQHTVTITQAFWMFDTPCTQALWEAVMGDNPSHFKGSDRPVENVSWIDYQNFNQRLASGVSDLEVALPTEAEWEYACRADTTTATYSGDLNIVDDLAVELNAIAWYWGDRSDGTQRVRQKKPNAWGLYDMLGNVREWCHDGRRTYEDQEEVDPVGSEHASAHQLVRGGYWHDFARDVRAAYRGEMPSGIRSILIGFRCRVQASEFQQAVSEGRASARGRSPQSGGDSRATSVARAAWINLIEQESDQTQVPQGLAVRIVTDVEELTLRRISKPSWASAIGRDRFGLWAEFELPLVDADDSAMRSVPRVKAGVVTQRLRWIPPGRFIMGSPKGEPGRYDEYEFEPRLQVIEHGFWLFDTQCTQELWAAVMGGRNPSYFQSPTRPVEQISWDDCQKFCDQIKGDAGILLALPTEAEWEYACRAGTIEATYKGPLAIFGESNAPVVDKIAWYRGNSGCDFDLENGWDVSSWREKQYQFDKGGTRVVGTKDANSWGLFDMLGNVYEWCEDVWRLPGQGEKEPASADRVIRGGSWESYARIVRAASRLAHHPEDRDYSIGFRCRVQDSEFQHEELTADGRR